MSPPCLDTALVSTKCTTTAPSSTTYATMRAPLFFVIAISSAASYPTGLRAFGLLQVRSLGHAMQTQKRTAHYGGQSAHSETSRHSRLKYYHYQRRANYTERTPREHYTRPIFDKVHQVVEHGLVQCWGLGAVCE